MNDQIDDAVREVEAAEDERIVKAAFMLPTGKAEIRVPHPFTADMFESVIVVLLNMRASSDARVEAEKPIATPPPTLLVAPDGRKLSSIRRKPDA